MKLRKKQKLHALRNDHRRVLSVKPWTEVFTITVISISRPFLSALRGPLSRDIPSLEGCFPFTVYF